MEIAFYVLQSLIALLGVWVTLRPPDKKDTKKHVVYLSLFIGLAIAGGVITWKQMRDASKDKSELKGQLAELQQQSEKTGTAVQTLTGSPLKVEVIPPKTQPQKPAAKIPCLSPTGFTTSQMLNHPSLGTGYITEIKIPNPKGIQPTANFAIHFKGIASAMVADKSLADKRIGFSGTPGIELYRMTIQSEIPKGQPIIVFFRGDFNPLQIVCIDRFPDLPSPK